MNKTILIILMLFLSLLTFSSDLQKISETKLNEILNTPIGPVYSYEYIGESSSNYYIEYKAMIHLSSLFDGSDKLIIYWIPKKDVSAEQINKIEQYNNRFKKYKNLTVYKNK